MKKLKYLALCFTISALVLAGCNGKDPNNKVMESTESSESESLIETKESETKETKTKESEMKETEIKETEPINDTNTNNKSDSNSNGVANTNNQTASNSNQQTNANSEGNQDEPSTKAGEMAANVKEFILNGQSDVPYAAQYSWSDVFLDLVDMDTQYKNYIDQGGQADDVKAFAEYITLNAPVPENWEELVKQDILESYGAKITRVEHYDGVQYQFYSEYDGKEVPYVLVNSRTGYFHG